MKKGRLVAFPTETVYGLGAIADMDEAVEKVFSLKGRPKNHPLIVHLQDIGQIDKWALEFPSEARKLAQRFMPGPMTLVLKRKKGVGNAASGGHPTIALRVPSHKMAQKLLQKVGGAVVAPSANKFGRPSPTKPSHVADDFAESDLLVLDGGKTDLGIESTVVDMTDPNNPAVLRVGAVDRAAIEECLGRNMAPKTHGAIGPGTLASHYAPRQRLVVLGKVDYPNCKKLMAGKNIAAYGFEKPNGIDGDMWLKMGDKPIEMEKNLYSDLRALEKTGATVIVANEVPNSQEWEVIADRLRRASAGDKD